MSDNTRIEWANAGLPRGASWNPIRARNKATGKVGWHCTHQSDGCRFCYAESMNKRLGTGLPYKPGHEKDIEIFLDEKILLQPLKWRDPRGVFVGSMTDVFAPFVTDEMLDRMFSVALLCPQHRFLWLTKRPDRMRAYLSDDDLMDRLSATLGCMLDGDWIWNEGKRHRWKIEALISACLGVDHDDDGNEFQVSMPVLFNIWAGTSAEDQETYDERKEHLRATPAAVRFFSLEPLLGPIRGDWFGDWAIIGGESGPNARPNWTPNVRRLVKRCKRAGAAVFVKQLGANVQDRNDAGFEGCEPHEWPDIDPADVEHDLDGTYDGYQGAPVRIRLRDRKGGNWDEWPADLRIREMPEVTR